uniref:AB hydrolase-1 domain-containing protein n=1 Tax=Sander lucioperca TaxID=283035 RepID=A0A8C9Z773_SANLU
MKRAVLFLITVYASVPVILYLFPWILGHIIFAHFLRFPYFLDLSRPEDVLNHTCNFYLNTEDGVSVGVWHTLPASQWEDAPGKSPEWYKETLGDGRPVFIYLHGNGATRWDESGRIGTLELILIGILSAAGYHVLSLDYRGFGDSTGEPSEAGMTSDALYLYHWVKKQSRGGPVCLWGHSLGTGVATNTAVKVQEQGSICMLLQYLGNCKIFLHTLYSVFFQMYMFLPGFESLLWSILEKNNIVFANDKNLKTLTSPLLVLHSKDDDIVPYNMGLKLYQISLQTKKEYNADVPVEMISYSANLGFSHNSIYLDPNLSNVIGRSALPPPEK